MMKIEVWSDYACPYCYIGKHRLEEAIASFEHADQIEVDFKVFELDPTSPKEVTTTTQVRIEHKYRKSPAEAKQMIDSIISMGARVNLDMRYYTVAYTNTFDAHRLTKFAKTKGKAAEMSERLFKAYFTDNLPLADHEVLLNIAEELGLNRNETQEMLTSDAFAYESREDERFAGQTGINSVPYFVIDGKEEFVGAQPKEFLLKAIETLWAERSAAEIKADDEVLFCGIDGKGC